MVTQDNFVSGVSAFCEKCGRPLSNPDSVAAGIGPICAHKSPVAFAKSGGRVDYGSPKAASLWYLFEYKCDVAPQRVGVAASLQRLNGNGNLVIILAQPLDYTGYSITNGYEWAMTHYYNHVINQQNPLLGSPIFMEHYSDDDGFSVVKLKWGFAHNKLVWSAPDWTYIDRGAAELLFGGEIPAL